MLNPLSVAVLEDHDELRNLTMDALRRHGYSVAGAADAESLDELLASRRVDVLLLDISLPGEDGLSVARRLRAAHPSVFIVMVTAKGATADKVTGYASGADMYLSKPVSLDELLAAIAGIRRRIDHERDGGAAGALMLDFEALELTGTETVPLTRTEAILLMTLARAPDRTVQNFQLLEATQRPFDVRAKATLEVQIVGLRKKIAAAGLKRPSLRALRSQGYQLLCPVQVR